MVNIFHFGCLFGVTCYNVCVYSADIAECDSDPCMNDGTCLEEVVGSFKCNCNGYKGDNCQDGKLTAYDQLYVENVYVLLIFILSQFLFTVAVLLFLM